MAPTIEIVNKENVLSGKGSIDKGRLSLSLKAGDGHSYSLAAELHERKLAGQWKQLDGDQQGTWSAEWVDPMPGEDKSPAVVALWEYRGADGEKIYSTNPQLDAQNSKRTAEPLCRVWMNPTAVLVLDAKARPVALGKQ